ncbi:TPA: hypothetical protein ACXNZR_004647 [Klebsiella aerogenes]|nr:hypothetical protein [Klebsiella aerogenes]
MSLKKRVGRIEKELIEIKKAVKTNPAQEIKFVAYEFKILLGIKP